ncbi:uncharacterized protein TM35_000451120 [Trypanosoma theileri]|uniref:Mucin-associated surface protein (MASP) n=1 Tax=Trypanosoma theileri TaxID=67003 RepID=A0A1X0NHY8_9TRYP|nr:uncharacterized protein TM35_000451120 [Trypanosoma theileri]ORC84374.1 hypothetical protein TM35_000451120 [Trypanosoma theileri]
MMMMMRRVMCVLAAVLCCACGYTMTIGVAAIDGSSNKDLHEAADISWDQFPAVTPAIRKKNANYKECRDAPNHTVEGINCAEWDEFKPKPPIQPNPTDTLAHPTAELGRESTRVEPGRVSKPPAADSPRETSDREGSSTDVVSSVNPPQEAGNAESTTGTGAKPTQSPPHESAAAPQSNNEESNAGNSGSGADSKETNTTTPQSPESNVTDAPTTTPSPAPNAEISSNIVSTVQKNKPIVDSSVSPVWMRTAAPLLIVVVLFSATVY